MRHKEISKERRWVWASQGVTERTGGNRGKSGRTEKGTYLERNDASTERNGLLITSTSEEEKRGNIVYEYEEQKRKNNESKEPDTTKQATICKESSKR